MHSPLFSSFKSGSLLERVEQKLSRFLPHSTLCVGLSGGLDSVVLLHLLATLRHSQLFVLRALHVHHGLSPNADAWAQFAMDCAANLGVKCAVERVSLAPFLKQGTEGAARTARYAAFARQDCDVILLAQHCDDQAETVLLNLLRGSGLRGLAAMPEYRSLNQKMGILRPLLGVARAELAAYAAEQGLIWVEDESNHNPRYDRNFLRNDVFPRLNAVWPSANNTLARVARHVAEADELLLEVACSDFAVCVQDNVFDLSVDFSPLRLRNVLRYWLVQNGLQLDARAFEELIRTAVSSAADAQPVLIWRKSAVRRYRQKLYITLAEIELIEPVMLPWQPEINLKSGCLSWREAEVGIALEILKGADFELRPRVGGECLRLFVGGARKALKQLYQDAGVPPWLRQNIPLVYLNGELAAVPGLGVDAAFCTSGQVVVPYWRPSLGGID
ncbi:tRNA lysidine(34) synthetase TilS [Iodobacter ciconiae]|uniref:tRNA(Ile)-lysidine synthase n=1 Tax=Iodobacter ciconiae TaxID=2496266 RepID=A0A3S8ZR84_9NEIS|nr:tRNA lysidine(34) synthetase TilS [Iodobacter ciconiae]AZN35931.1 tRNA lysidine(34) synthetase TilS [Iodobacter ciconiae]